jgi:hypothetical protein
MAAATAALVQPGGEGRAYARRTADWQRSFELSAASLRLMKNRSHLRETPMTRSAVAKFPTQNVRHFWFAATGAALMALAMLAPGKAHAAMPFDGNWTVSIQTQSGSCDRSYNFAVSIVDGRLDGANGALLGNVNSKGGISVMLGGGDRRGTASGRLMGNSGSGRWSGNATGASCSGNWTARRG